jgi:hypothetical protein
MRHVQGVVAVVDRLSYPGMYPAVAGRRIADRP